MSASPAPAGQQHIEVAPKTLQAPRGRSTTVTTDGLLLFFSLSVTVRNKFVSVETPRKKTPGSFLGDLNGVFFWMMGIAG
jgi:hypothetical protein